MIWLWVEHTLWEYRIFINMISKQSMVSSVFLSDFICLFVLSFSLSLWLLQKICNIVFSRLRFFFFEAVKVCWGKKRHRLYYVTIDMYILNYLMGIIPQKQVLAWYIRILILFSFMGSANWWLIHHGCVFNKYLLINVLPKHMHYEDTVSCFISFVSFI